MPKDEQYSPEPENGGKHTEEYDQFYSRFAGGYDWLVKAFPLWRTWIKSALPWIQGPKVLEISFGTGYLLNQYADQFTAYGVDYNRQFSKLPNRQCYSHQPRW